MNKMKRISSIFAVVILFSMTVNSLASGMYYLPDVTKEMSSPSYWTEENETLMSYEEIEELNKDTLSAKLNKLWNYHICLKSKKIAITNF